MDNLDDSENNAKISDSAYSNSCSNSQSRRSHSSKSTHSGSNSSGSSGYGGKPSTSGSSNQPPEKRLKEKDPKKKKQAQVEVVEAQVVEECRPPEPAPSSEAQQEEHLDVVPISSPALSLVEKGPENMDIASPDTCKDEVMSCNLPMANPSINFVTSRPGTRYCPDGFSCVISMHDGVVMYATLTLTTTLGFPKDMWIGRSFIDFIHPRDRSTFASQITSGLAVPNIANGTQEKVQTPGNSMSSMVCRIRRYRGLATGFGVKERIVTFMPFLLKLTFKNVTDEEGEAIYLVIQATPFFSAFKVPNEVVTKPIPFVMRHAANGNLEYIDPESVPYLGYLPQDVIGENALMLYHPDDLCYQRQVYETIVKEGGLARSKPYRMMTQNGDYVKLETEWSSFINPWSRKLEFVIGKHYILEGPCNPDVFQTPSLEKTQKSEEEKKKLQALWENIIKTMNEVLTKPAEVAKQLMSKRCQYLASFMESLIEEQPKPEDELRLEIQDADNSYYERDSMLGGISPHHDYNDSKSSTETPLSYNQLNYNETLQRYFDSHQPFSYDDYNTVTGENVLGLKDSKPSSNCLSPMANNSGDSAEMASSCESGLAVRGCSPIGPIGDYQIVRLTESLLNKHNGEMEKELMKMHRETRSSKGEREKTSNENRQKKKEHLARCNASFQPTAAGVAFIPEPVPEKKNRSRGYRSHGLKRSSKQLDSEVGAHKHHCPTPRQQRRRHVISTPPAQPSATITTTVAATHWHPNPVNNMSAFIVGVGIPQQMSIMSPVIPQQMAAVPSMPGMPGMFPMYYAPAASQGSPIPGSSDMSNDPTKNAQQFSGPAMQCMMYGQAVYGSPFMYSPIGPQVPYPMQQTMMAQTMQYSNTLNPLGLTSSNYEEACKPSLPQRPIKSGAAWKKRADSQATSSKTDPSSAERNTSTIALNRESGAISSGSQSSRRKMQRYSSDVRSFTNSYSPKRTEAMPGAAPCRGNKANNTRMRNSDETIDRTDGESSYSSFYSSFFKTESGSAEESGDVKKGNKNRTSTSEFWDKNTPDDQSSIEAAMAYFEPKQHKKVNRRKMEPPWMEQVCVTSELIYKYQILTKTMEEVLSADKKKMSNYAQPSLVNEQLGQLYLDLQLEGVAARLTLEEGVTSSSSSGEETSTNTTKTPRRKREYSKLVMIYEEDAPLPPPNADDKPATGPLSM